MLKSAIGGLLAALLLSGCGGRAQPVPAKPAPAPAPSPQQPLFQSKNFEVTAVTQENVSGSIRVAGRARVFEAMFTLVVEDGHVELARRHLPVSQGAPEWGDFDVTIPLLPATSPNGMLLVGVMSARDGSFEHELEIPLQFARYTPLTMPPAGPAQGHVPVPQDRANWAASAPTAAETVRLFLPEQRGNPTPVVEHSNEVTLFVRLDNLEDDSIKAIEYFVTVRRDGSAWKVQQATYMTECRRGASGGLCL